MLKMAKPEEYVLNVNYIEPGMIIKFNYKKVNGQKKNYFVVVVDKNHNGKMHAINAHEVSIEQLAQLGVKTSERLKRARNLDIPIIENMDRAGTEGYRTFLVGNINDVMVLKYPFPQQQIDATKELDIPKSAIEGQKTIEAVEAGGPMDEAIEQEVRSQPDDVIVQKIKQKLKEKFNRED
tara:strand:+ start:11795 stop:12334 length:540 start_codon:yes stop_codon:yes gene_type:complete